MGLSNRLEMLRKEKKLYQADVAAAINCSTSSISGYENGRYVPPDIVEKLAVFFDVSTDFLTGRSNDRHPIDDGRFAHAFALLTKLGGEDAPTAVEVTNLLWAAIRYYQCNAPCGAMPIDTIRKFIAGMTTALDAASSGNTSALIDGANAAAVAALDASRMVGEYYTRQDAVIFPVAAHGGGVSSTAATPDSAADQTLRERPSDTID